MVFKTTIIRKARFVYSPFSSEQMAGIADTVMQAVMARTKEGKNANDQNAKPLAPGRNNGKPTYQDRKIAAGIAPIRNWVGPRRYPQERIKTMRSIKVLSANENRAVIGFIDPKTGRIAAINNRKEKTFGISPNDRTGALVPAVNAALAKAVTVERES